MTTRLHKQQVVSPDATSYPTVTADKKDPSNPSLQAGKSGAKRKADSLPTGATEQSKDAMAGVEEEHIAATSAHTSNESKQADGKLGRARSRSPAREASQGDLPGLGSEITLGSLGLKVHETEGGGNCFYHALGYHLKQAGLKPVTHGAVRAAIVAHMQTHAEKFRPIWDGLSSMGRSTTWTDYLAEMAKNGSWAGELEWLAACDHWHLQIAVIRPELPTLLAGAGNRIVWLKFHDSHYEAVTTDAAAKHAWRAHLHAVPPCFRLALDDSALRNFRKQVQVRGGGGSDALSSAASTLRAAANASAETLADLAPPSSVRTLTRCTVLPTSIDTVSMPVSTINPRKRLRGKQPILRVSDSEHVPAGAPALGKRKYGQLGQMLPSEGDGVRHVWWKCHICPFTLYEEGDCQHFVSANAKRRQRHLWKEHGLQAPKLSRHSLTATAKMCHSLAHTMDYRWKRQHQSFMDNAWPGARMIQEEGAPVQVAGRPAWSHVCRNCQKSILRGHVPSLVCALEPRLMAGEKIPSRQRRQEIWAAGRKEASEVITERRCQKYKRPNSRAETLANARTVRSQLCKQRRQESEIAEAELNGVRVGEASHPGP